MASRIPANADEHVRQSCNDCDQISSVPYSRWDLEAFKHIRFGAFLDNVDEFDASLFHINLTEARHMDPQQRLLLEVISVAYSQ